MANPGEELIKRPLYVYDLPQEILLTLQLKDELSQTILPSADDVASSRSIDATAVTGTACTLCQVTFGNVTEQRVHVKSDFHGYNLKQRLRGRPAVDEAEFERLLEELNESISGSESSAFSEDDETDGTKKDGSLSTLLKKHTTIEEEPLEVDGGTRHKGGSGRAPLLWFTSSTFPSNTSLGIYRAIFSHAEQENPATLVDIIGKKQLDPVPAPKNRKDDKGSSQLSQNIKVPHVFMCMIGGGHFAAMVVSLAPKAGKNTVGSDQRQTIVLAHKTFHRYTTRRKQGGAQSANDAAKGAAHSAGSSLRRYNEAALTSEIRELLTEWKPLIDSSELLFVRATGSTNRRTLFGPYDGQVLRQNDPRLRGFPFSTRRATQSELLRCFVELTRVKVSQVDEAALAAAAAAEAERAAASAAKQAKKSTTASTPKVAKEEEEAALHTSQLQSIVRRSRAPALLSYLSNNKLSPNFLFHPPNSQQHHHAPDTLHLAASLNSPSVVLALLTKAHADPTLQNADGKTPFDLAGDRATRDAFRVARYELGEACWAWDAAHVPAALSKADADKREDRERREAEKKEAERRKVDVEKLRKEEAARTAAQPVKKGGKVLGIPEKTAEEKREEEARGMTPEMRMRLERERRARAAEERIRRMQGQ